MSARVVNAIPPTNTSLAGFAFGAMYPLLAPVLLLVPVHRGRCELLHTSLVVQKMMGYSKATCDGVIASYFPLVIEAFGCQLGNCLPAQYNALPTQCLNSSVMTTSVASGSC